MHLPVRELHCHHCGHRERVPAACPTCGNPDLAPVGQGTQRVEGVAEEGQQPAEPVVHPRLAQPEEFGHDDLEGVGLEVDQHEQQFLFRPVQHPLAAAPGAPLTGPARRRPAGGAQLLAGACEAGQQGLKFGGRQARERQAG